MEMHCTNCQQSYPPEGTPYRCQKCGGIFDFRTPLVYDPAKLEPGKEGMWRYRQTFGLPQDAAEVSLGEGGTPLVWTEYAGRKVAVKCEYQNPSGSFKDRGSAVIVSFLLSRGAQSAVEDSSGNAGASFAAYAARAGMHARVFVPDAASGPKRKQIETYGAELVRIMGPRSNAADAVQRVADQGEAYASHAYLPFNLPGYATAAYEIVEQLGEAPGSMVVPVGQGGFLLGMARGFEALQHAGMIGQIPMLAGVQARACAPLWALFSYGSAGLSWVAEAPTVAEGIRVLRPLRGDVLMETMAKHGGMFLAVDEEEILPARDALAHRGFYVEPTSAVVWIALGQVIEKLPDPVVIVLTGSGLKSG